MWNRNIFIEQLCKEILSFALGRYWFITSYLALYILSPYLNIMLNNLEKLQLQNKYVIVYRCAVIVCYLKHLCLGIVLFNALCHMLYTEKR